MQNPKVLLFDIETAPLLGYAFGLYEQNILHVVRNPYIISFAYKWLDEKRIHCHALPDYPLYKKDPHNDTSLIKDLHALIESADVVIAHNGDKFDIKVANGRFAVHNLEPLSPRISIDTLKVAKSRFRLPSNKLTDLAQYAGVGEKLPTDKDLWIDCIDRGILSRWAEMKRYNTHDVFLLEGIYLWMRPWMKTHPNSNVFNEKSWNCPTCGSHKINKSGFQYTATGKYQEFRCKDCHSTSHGNQNVLQHSVRVK